MVPVFSETYMKCTRMNVAVAGNDRQIWFVGEGCVFELIECYGCCITGAVVPSVQDACGV